ncbi:MAG: DNA recombination protein RmuC [Rhodospirillales bacterium]
MFPSIPLPNATIAAAGVLLAALLLAALLLRSGRLARALERQRLLAEQNLAAGRGEAETLRAVLMTMERAISARVGDLHAAMEQRLGEFSARMAREQGDARVQLEQKLREMADAQASHMAALHRGVNETLHQAVEQQMQSSFSRVLEQFTAVQKAVGDVQAVAAQIGDLKRVFANVKTRGGWGETQLRVLLDDFLPDGYLTNVRLRDDSAEIVEFAVRLPGRGEAAKLLPIDAKFPLVDYEKLLAATDEGDQEAERVARRALEARLRLEARKIAEKYLAPPVTTDFAVMYLPTDGLYAEAARVPGLIDDLGRLQIMVMGPSLLPALLRTVRLGYVTLALEEKAGQIGRLLGATRQEMLRMDDVLEKLARGAGTMSRTIEDARRRTRAVGRKLRDVELLGPAEAEEALALQAEETLESI